MAIIPAKRVRVVLEDELGELKTLELPAAGDQVLQVELTVDRPQVVAGVTENGVQKTRPGPVTFAQLAVVVRHKE